MNSFVQFFFGGLCVGCFLAVGVWFIRVSFNFVRSCISDSPAWENIM